MGAVVLESALGSQYEDSPTSYEFPAQYLKHFSAAAADPPVFAVLYEPRGDEGRGRMKYVGVAEIAGPPILSGRVSESGRPLYVVHYTGPALLFDEPVPREILGDPLETWLRRYERGRARNVATFGRAVRPLELSDFQRILELSGTSVLGGTQYPVVGEHQAPLVAVRERSEALVAVLRRSADFRRQVISAYEERCAVSGFRLGRVPVSRAAGLLDAAHIRPVSYDGSDDLTNGLPLTPTLHRLFDAGLFTLVYNQGRPEVRVSPRLEPSMVISDDARFRLDLRDGQPAAVPRDHRLWPSPDQLRFHQAKIFVGSV